MGITAEQLLEDACAKYRELCQLQLTNQERYWPEVCREKCEVDTTKGIVVLRSCEGRYLRSYQYRHDNSMWDPYVCRECGKAIKECYMAKDELWKQLGYGPLDLVCPGCLGKRLGRRLTREDFASRHPWVSRHIWSIPGLRRSYQFTRKVLAYAGRQIFCAEKIIAWGHAGRWRLGRKLVEPYAGQKLLDYACGDAGFLTLIHDQFPQAFGADIQQSTECAKRFAERKGLSFLTQEELRRPQHIGAFGLVVCLELFEHCVEESWDQTLSDLHRLSAPGATIIISVPIEIGPSLIGKHIVRTVARWRGLNDYQERETYTVGQFWTMVFAGERTTIDRPVYRAESASQRWNLFHRHKGFNWRRLRARLREKLIVERTCFSPLGWSGGYLSSQAWFICKPR